MRAGAALKLAKQTISSTARRAPSPVPEVARHDHVLLQHLGRGQEPPGQGEVAADDDEREDEADGDEVDPEALAGVVGEREEEDPEEDEVVDGQEEEQRREVDAIPVRSREVVEEPGLEDRSAAALEAPEALEPRRPG
ncbi:MAG: hypothetical protein R3F20_10065 [Planctomycetota bacterium]